MLAYVRKYNDKNYRAADTPDWDVEFSSAPYSYGSEWEARGHCNVLNKCGIHVGDSHYCQFDVEQIDSENWAIICKTH